MTIGTQVSAPDRRRDQEIERYQVLGAEPGRDLQALVDLAAQVAGVQAAAINMVTSDQAHAIATTGVAPYSCTREDSMCTPVLADPAAVVVADARRDGRYAENPMVTGVLAHVRFYASIPLRTSAGDVIGRLCVFDPSPHTLDAQQETGLHTLADRVMDVLDLRLRNRQLEGSLTDLTHARDELRRSNDQLALFARQVSHDLRTPLTGVIANIESLLDEPAVGQDPDLASLAFLAQRSAERMAGLIEDFLGQATYGATVFKVDTDVREVMDSVMHDLGSALRDSSAEVTVGELPTVCADPIQLYSVVLNLMSNAIKFARPGVPPRIGVHCVTLPDRWRIEVSDEGVGIPVEERSAVFDLAKRLDPLVKGHGIGLLTARRIVEQHGGRIGVSAERGLGTQVWLELPR